MRAAIFDCDGTVLDTLPDLVALTNRALDEFGMPARTREQVLSFVGFGAARLVEQAVPAGTPPVRAAEVLSRWQQLYPQMGFEFTRPYPGMPEALAGLAARGVVLGMLSNKFDAAVRECARRFYPGVFSVVHGEGPGFPRKPDPAGLRACAAEAGVAIGDVLYVGDSPVDVQVARAAGCAVAACTWGYNPREALVTCAPDYLLDAPAELLGLL